MSDNNLKSITFDELLNNINLIVLKDSESVKKKKAKSDGKEHFGKEPLANWEYCPEDYKGFEDTKYGTAFQCCYIKSLSLFFIVIDIDVHNPDTDIPLNNIESAIPDKYKDTYIVNTPSGGRHYYYLSEKPPELSTNSINIDYKSIFKRDVEKQQNGTYINNGNGGYVVASFRWDKDGDKKEHYVHNSSSNDEILIVHNTDDIIRSIYESLYQSGDINDDIYNAFNGIKTEKVHNIVLHEIQVYLDDLDNIPKLKGIQKDGAAYEQNGLRYDSNGVILLKEHNGLELITQKVAEIISSTHGKHNDVLLALEGGLDHYGFNEDQRRKILFDALILADDYNSGHRAQIESSINKDKNNVRKKGFQHLEKNYPQLKEQLNVIYNIKHLFWRMHDSVDYKLMEIPYLELVNTLSKYIQEREEQKEKEIEEKKDIPLILDSYLKMMGVNVHERYKLLKKINGVFCGNILVKFIQNELECSNNPKKEHALLTNKGINLGSANNIIKQLDGEKRRKLTKRAYSLEIQLSLIEYGGNYPKIQPLINLVERPARLEPYKRRQIANSFLRQHDYLKKTKDNSYIFDDVETNSYIQVDANKLGNYLSRKYPILQLGIESSELETILTTSAEFDELHNEYYMFNNGILNLHERSFTETTDFSNYFTTKKMDCNYLSNKITIDPIRSNPACLVDRVLREIFIPNYRQNGKDLFTGYYTDFLQRLGSAFNTRIKEKKFPCYYGSGDNGKDIIIEILKMAFSDRCLLVTMEILQDEKADLSEYDVVIIDELDKKTFKDAIAFIKRITGGEEEGTAKRKHYSHEVFRPKNPSAFFLFTNTIPEVPLSDKAFYRREDALELKNRFVDNPKKDKLGEYQADSSLKDKIKNEKEDSLEWLINASLQAYYNCFDDDGFFKGFMMAQTAEETMMIVSNTDTLTKFLRENYVVDEEKVDTVSNAELRDNYQNYCNRNNISCDTTKLAQNMGNTVKKIFGDVKKKATNATRYFLKPKDETDLLTTYYINSTKQWWQVQDQMPEATFETHNNVYNRLVELEKSSTYPTKKQLLEEFPVYDIEEILENLEKANLIFKGKKLEVDENVET
ncbi:hypothetical protein [Methanobrevibacter thaueri]|uniref:SF3 helicase domain-containing protein n=1 Tax=Methanobrevibacter thaueri TaxID=190975 RepID=A0A315XPU0_9EURY|nr:hypothetical protein [Methanobrevibacter thaueri]PWB87888.1 hypothetical protein MBBTH_04750 [Methanobrevibacter thaueri]